MPIMVSLLAYLDESQNDCRRYVILTVWVALKFFVRSLSRIVEVILPGLLGDLIRLFERKETLEAYCELIFFLRASSSAARYLSFSSSSRFIFATTTLAFSSNSYALISKVMFLFMPPKMHSFEPNYTAVWLYRGTMRTSLLISTEHHSRSSSLRSHKSLSTMLLSLSFRPPAIVTRLFS